MLWKTTLAVCLVVLGAWPGVAAPRVLPADTLVRVRILDTLSSKTNHTGDRFRYVVVENVSHEGRVFIRKGTHGKGFLTKVKRAGRFGQNGQIVSAFGQVKTTVGAMVTLTISKRAREYNDKEKLAAGASFLGLVALGPVGLVGGAFVKGKDVTIASDSQLYVSTEERVP